MDGVVEWVQELDHIGKSCDGDDLRVPEGTRLTLSRSQQTTNPAITLYLFDLIKRFVIPVKHQEHPSPMQTFLAGAFASSVASAITYPLILSKVCWT